MSSISESANPLNLARQTNSSTTRNALLLGGIAALVGAAIFVRSKTAQAERAFPPVGNFIEVNGVKLHYTDTGEGTPIVLLHGNGAMIEDFQLSGLLDQLLQEYRVIVFDRPGYGHSTRPKDQAFDPESQAALLHDALVQLGVERPVVLGHSWGTLVAVAMALNYPQYVHGAVLLSGYYVPTPRLDTWLMSMPSIPLLGTLMRYTVSPIISSLTWKGITKTLFSPNEVPAQFSRFPKWLTLRPSQLLASAQESAMMVPYAKKLSQRYGELDVPVMIVGGENDKIVRTEFQANGMAEKLKSHPQPTILPGAGHMIHYVRTDEVYQAVAEIAQSEPARPTLQ
ncbi:MAG: alpha/beta hydrolase [Pseudomonadota bacterium]